MGYLLKEALKTLCGVSQWSYAVFWKIGCQNPKLLIWEEYYYEPTSFSVVPRISGIERPEVAFEDWEACLVSSGAQTSLCGAQAEDKVHSLVNKMMISNHVNVVGEGLVGRAAFTGKHQWIHLETYAKEVHPPEVLNELCQQFSAGMQTIAVIPVLPHGVVQLGSSVTIMENMGVVDSVKSLILQLGCVPGALLLDNYTAKEPVPMIGGPFSLGNSVSSDQSENYKVPNAAPFIADYCSQQNISSQASGLVGQHSHSPARQIQDSLQGTAAAFKMPSLVQNLVKYHNELCQPKVMPLIKPDLPFRDQLENRVAGAEVIPSNPEVWLKQQASLYMPQSGINQQSYFGTSSTNYSNLRAVEEEIFSGAFVQENGNNSSNASSGFMASVLGTNGGLIASPHKDSVNNTLLEGSQLQNGVTGHLGSISDPCSLPSSYRAAGSIISCTRLGSSGLQNAGSFKTEVSTSDVVDQSASGFFSGSSDCRRHLTHNKSTQMEMSQKKEKIENDIFDAIGIPATHLDEKMGSNERIHGSLHDVNKQDDGNCSLRSRNAKDKDGCAKPSSGDDLFDILGVDFKNKLLDGSWNSFLNDGSGSNTKSSGKNHSTFVNLQEAGCDLLSVSGGNSHSGIFSMSGSDHLLDAVVSRVHSTPKQSCEYSVSCSTTLTNSSAPNASSFYGPVSVSDQMQGELFDLPKALLKTTGAIGSCSFKSGCSKEEAGNCSQTSSLYGSQISSWVEQGHNMKRNSSISTAYSKRPDEISKSNRKRLKPGENPRPRPKDRQMIQDRVKELREIVPNGAKCSIDALLERTIKHMLFLQSVMKHADKLKQTGESKIISKEGGLLLKDNFEGGATWAYEVGSQSMVCPIIVEDLNPPRQMLVEMLCEERGLFLEIADIIRGLGLTILKGVMETRNDKIWARFAVEANRDVTRMEIFLSLVRLLEQTVKSSAAPVNSIDNDNVMVHQPFLEAASIPAVGRPCSLQ